VVTLVSGLYAIGRITADAKTQAFLETQPNLPAAIARACELAAGDGRVFLAHGQNHTSVPADCPERGEPAKRKRRAADHSRRAIARARR
jgi:hypothetical protein